MLGVNKNHMARWFEDPFLTARKTVLAAQDPISLFGAA